MRILISIFFITTTLRAMESKLPKRDPQQGPFQQQTSYYSFPFLHKPEKETNTTEQTYCIETDQPIQVVMYKSKENEGKSEKCAWKGCACGCCALCLICSAGALAVYYCPGIVISGPK